MRKSNKFIIMLLLLFIKDLASQGNTVLPKATTTGIILNDIHNAFKTVTNNTHLLNKIIPQMYGSVMQRSKFVVLFEIPNDSVNNETSLITVKNGYSMWAMERRDLVDPVFPNLTFEYMRAQLNKNRLTLNKSVNLDNDTPKSEGQSYGRNSWNILGLAGWEGPVASDHVEPAIGDAYPASDILMDLDSDEGYENGEKDDGVANVYISRVNDPFGTSVKWELRNSTDRLKRDVLTLYSMIQCSTGCQPLIYKGYGCYCGFSGAGIPTDGIDRCCKVHDKCYEFSNCISYLEYFVPYVWKCYRRKPLCAIDHGEFGGPGSCAARLCQCDIQLARCLRRFSCPKRRTICYTSKARRLQNFLLTL